MNNKTADVIQLHFYAGLISGGRCKGGIATERRNGFAHWQVCAEDVNAYGYSLPVPSGNTAINVCQCLFVFCVG